jgi:hypothetical protein
MYYVKSKIKDLEINIEIEDNVYTKCNECGREISIDLFEHFDSGCDLCSTVCFCSECSKKMKKLNK